MAQIGPHAHDASGAHAAGAGDVDDLLKGQDVGGRRRGMSARRGWIASGADQRLQLLEGEILGEPPGERGAVDGRGLPPRGELLPLRHIRRPAQFVVRPGDQDSIRARDQLRGKEVGALGYRGFRRRRGWRSVR